MVTDVNKTQMETSMWVSLRKTKSQVKATLFLKVEIVMKENGSKTLLTAKAKSTSKTVISTKASLSKAT